MARLINKRDVALYVEELTEQKNHGIPYIKLDRANKGRAKGKIELYPITIVNLLGKYGNFENDSDGNGVADNWAIWNATSVSIVSGIIGSYAQQAITDNSGGSSTKYVQIRMLVPNILAEHTFFVSFYYKIADVNSNTRGIRFLFYNYDSNNTDVGASVGEEERSSGWKRYYEILTTPAETDYIYAIIENPVASGCTDDVTVDGAMVVDLTEMGELPPPLKEYFQNQVTYWEDLATTSNIPAIDGRTQTGEDWLAELLFYCDSVATAGYSLIDGQLNIIFENKGKNLMDIYPRTYAIDEIFDSEYHVFPINTVGKIYLPIFVNYKFGETYTISFEVKGDIVAGENPGHVRIDYDGVGTGAQSSFALTTNYTRQSITFTVDERAFQGPLILYLRNALNTGIWVRNIQLEKGSVATEYVSPRRNKIEVANELWTFEGIYERIFEDNGQAKKIKHFAREPKVSDGSGNITLSGYKSGTKCILINEDNGETKIVDVGSTIATGWNNANVTVIYKVPSPTIEELGTNELKLFKDDNYVLVSQMVKDIYTGDGTTTTFNLSKTANSTYYQVYVNGEVITEGVTKTTTSFTFDEAPKNGALIEVYYNTSFPSWAMSIETLEPTGNEELLDFITNLSINVQNHSRTITNVYNEQEIKNLNEVYQIRFTRNILENIDDFYQQYKDKTFRLKILNTSTNEVEYLSPCKIVSADKDYFGRVQNLSIIALDYYKS